jgi:hypothetical protein
LRQIDINLVICIYMFIKTDDFILLFNNTKKIELFEKIHKDNEKFNSFKNRFNKYLSENPKQNYQI